MDLGVTAICYLIDIELWNDEAMTIDFLMMSLTSLLTLES